MKNRDLLSKVQSGNVIDFGVYCAVQSEIDKSILVSMVPCVNFRTKTITALVAGEAEIDLVNVIVPADVPELQSKEPLAQLIDLLNRKLDLVDSEIKLVLHSLNGVHVDKCGSVTSFVIGATKFIEFKESGIFAEDPESPMFQTTVSYRNKTYGVRSKYLKSSFSDESIVSFIHAFLPSV
jgi:hypothetical protein